MTSALYACVSAKVISAVQDAIYARTTPITGQTRFEEDLGLDSMDLTEVLFHLEEVFDTRFSTGAVLTFRRVSEVTDYLSAHFFQDADVADEVEEQEELEALAA